ncbi:MAG: hypothetical protein RI996_562 [Candidatus Parcubacteria bacterium]|jgi:hypothetical protein
MLKDIFFAFLTTSTVFTVSVIALIFFLPVTYFIKNKHKNYLIWMLTFASFIQGILFAYLLSISFLYLELSSKLLYCSSIILTFFWLLNNRKRKDPLTYWLAFLLGTVVYFIYTLN